MESFLLDDELLTGAHAVRRWLATERDGHLVDRTSADDAVAAIEELCKIWGGAYHVMLPVGPDDEGVPLGWQHLVRDMSPIRIATRDVHPTPEDKRGEPGLTWVTRSGGDLPLAVLATLDRPASGFGAVRGANAIGFDEPWGVAYNAVWGRVPEISSNDLRLAGLVPDLAWTDIIEVDTSHPGALGSAELLQSLREPQLTTAAALSCVNLSLAQAPAGSTFDTAPDIPLRYDEAREMGPNLVVVYEPGSVDDLALLWLLRSLHGLRSGLPLGVPVTEDVAGALSLWWRELAVKPWGLRRTHGYVISASVEKAALERIAEAADGSWACAEFAAALQPSWGCGVLSTETAIFAAGAAELLESNPDEGRVMEATRDFRSRLQREVSPVGMRLPPSPTLADELLGAYRGGALSTPSETKHTFTTRWPSGLAVLDALMRDHGLRGEPSEAGRLAETLLKRCADDGMYPLLHTSSHDLLTRLGERQGLVFFRGLARRVLDFPEDTPADMKERLAAVEERVTAIAGESSEGERRDITFDDVRRALRDRQATEAWLAWADEVGLLLRGAQVQCLNCMSRSWLPLADLAPPISCRGCGKAIQRPFGYDLVKFRYRATDLLTRLIKSDVIVHVLTLRWFARMFGPSFGETGRIFGAYPGYAVRRESEKNLLGEADVILVMADGTLAVGECKTRAGGLIKDEVEKLRLLAEAVDASWTFAATLDRAATCGPIWQTAPDTGRPHFALTAEHLLEPHPVNALGSRPLAWRESFYSRSGQADQSDEDHDADVISILRSMDSWRQNQRRPAWTWRD